MTDAGESGDAPAAAPLGYARLLPRPKLPNRFAWPTFERASLFSAAVAFALHAVFRFGFFVHIDAAPQFHTLLKFRPFEVFFEMAAFACFMLGLSLPVAGVTFAAHEFGPRGKLKFVAGVAAFLNVLLFSAMLQWVWVTLQSLAKSS